jgi:hypothetical protein
MDIKTMYGFILMGAGFAFQAVANYYGINGNIATCVDAMVATGLFLFAGKEAYNKTKETVK